MKKIKINLVLVSLLSAFPLMAAAAAQSEEVVYEDGPVDEQYADYQYVYEDANGQPVAAGADQREEVTPGNGQSATTAQLYYNNQAVEPYPQQAQVYQPEVVAYEPAQSAQPVQPTPAPVLSANELGERLLTAARDGKLGDVRWLLRKGADPEYKAHANALSPLDLVVKGGWVDVAKVFQEEGVDFNKRGDLGVTFLHQAAAAGKLPMVRFLVSAGISPNATTDKGWTPLHHAARFGHAQVVDYLLKAGANTEERNSDGFRPRELAINARHPQVVQLL